ncbi:MAG TPA: hypothetical protein VFZ65_16795 [Planctomycetota bacterium]|nr:hypothetical protein [Planctomycetota bacterium]
MHRPILLPTLFLTAALPLSAQDMIGVTFSGAVLRIDSVTGASTVLANGQIGKNALAFTNDNRLWTTVRSGTSIATFQYHLAVIDPFTGAESLPFGTVNVGDLRGLARDDVTGGLFGIRDTGGPDELVEIDTSTGAVTVIGPTGFTGIQDLDITSAGPRAWDINAGLLLISLSSGLATDPFPGVAGPTALQFMVTNPADDREYVGRETLYELDTLHGTTTPIAAIAGAPDLRGVQFTTSRALPFGNSCNGPGGPVFIALNNAFGAGQAMTVVSVNHVPGVLGLQIVGFSDELFSGLPLPLSLDPLFGTVNCSLNVSADLTVLGVGQPTGVLAITMPVPASAAFQQFFVQHAAFDPVPGGLSFSRGLRVRSGL